MTDRVKNTAGFTLAELMMSIAIILILAAIALPSIITAQNNMRMVELNNAAQSIANAAQTQMTAKKVSGTWMALIEEGGTGTNAGSVKYPKAENLPAGAPSDTYYMTASQAHENGIIPSLSVDDSVRNGDYVIEFTASTAQVVSVFYTDGKTGFFSSVPEGEVTGARAYYKAKGSRDLDARKKASPMIGYYYGTPSGATPEVALKNPVIWVDESGRLCVQNPNLSDKSSTATTTEVTISLPGEDESATSITISGLDTKDNDYTVFSGDTSDSYSNAVKETQVYDLISRDSAANNVFVIDLNDLKRVLGNTVTTPGKVLAEVINSISSSGATLHVQAKVYSAEPKMPSIPATAEANIEWPEKIATLTVMVTNPSLDAKNNGGKSLTNHISGIYEDPETNLITDSGNTPVTGLGFDSQEETFSLATAGIETNSILTEENIESSRQSYSGGKVTLSEVVSQIDPDSGVNVYAEVKAGSYTPDQNSGVNVSEMKNPENGSVLWKNGGTFLPSGAKHTYQVYEIWINGERAGYLNQGIWTWEDTELGRQFKQCVSEISAGSTEVKINLSMLYKLVPQDFNGYEVYVRTTPNADEVKQYFTNNMNKIKDYFANNNRTTGMRGVNLGAPIRQPFENEFGASSTVGLFNITSAAPVDEYKSESVNSDGTSFFTSGDIRIYYSATSALAWKPATGNSGVYTEVPSAQLWGFKKNSEYNGSLLSAAYVAESRISGAAYSLTSSKSADFELSTKRDGLFYRVLDYRNEDGTSIEGLGLQYAPYSDGNARISEEPQKEGFTLAWNVDKGSTVQGASFVANTGALVSDYDASLKYGYVKLTAAYEELPKGAGLMYLEFGDNNEVGYYGYLNDQSASISNLLPNTDENGNSVKVKSWGYYAVVLDEDDASNKTLSLTGDGNSLVSISKKDYETVVIGSTRYRAYKFTNKSNKGLMAHYIEINLKYGEGNDKIDTTYYINLNFACAVSNKKNEANAWGTEEATAWNVRHADQFIGSLYLSTNQNEVQKEYLGSCFRQTHDIDMADRSSSALYKFDAVFRGVYDGGNFSITNVHVNQDKYFVSGDQRGSAMLFPKVEGSESKKAALRNIVITEDPSVITGGLVSWETNPINAYFGVLAGAVSYCEVSDCSLVGAEKEDDDPLRINVKTTQGNVYGGGALIGAAFDSTIDRSGVVGIYFDSKRTAGDWGSNLTLGSLVGYVSNSQIESSYARGVTVSTETRAHHTSSFNGYSLNIGGLVGTLAGASSLQKCSVNDAALVVPVAQNQGKNKLIVGGLVGNEVESDKVVDSSFINVSMVQGDVVTPIKSATGELIAEPTVSEEIEESLTLETEDARKEETDPVVAETPSPAEEVEQLPEGTENIEDGPNGSPSASTVEEPIEPA